MKKFSLSIIGRPNVGKSTLFNRLAGKRLAIVDDQPGVTRDRKYAEGALGDLEFYIIDTAGLENKDEHFLADRSLKQTEKAIEDSDVVLFVVDASVGVVPQDEFFANWLRKFDKKIIVVANKAEIKARPTLADFYKFGFGEPVGISAVHGGGLNDLYDALKPLYNIPDEFKEEEGVINIAIVGRPNAGKSTLLNQIIGEERSLTGPEAGITRDSISSYFEYQGKRFKLIDTAGLRKKSHIQDKIEKLSASETIRAIQFAAIVIFITDAENALEQQDLSILNLVIQEGRAIVLAINKWDKVKDKDKTKLEIEENIERYLPQIRDVARVYISAMTGKNVEKIFDEAIETYQIWNSEIKTSKLNEWLEFALSRHQLPLGKTGRRVRIKYITQTKTRPPTFLLFTSSPKEVDDGYMRYLANSLRDAFKLRGVPLRLILRKTKNPYEDKKK